MTSRIIRVVVITIFLQSLIYSSISSQIQIYQSNSKLIEVLYEINTEIFAKKSSNVRIITAENDTFLSQLTALSGASVTFELFEISKLSKISANSSSCNIIQIESEIHFDAVLKEVSTNKFQSGGYFLLVFEKCSSIDSNKLFKSAWREYLYNVNILCNENDETLIKTFLPFQQSSCSNTTSITLNASTSNFFPDKIKNLFGCPIKLASFFYPPITMRGAFDNGSFKYYGSEMEMVFGLAEALNFSIKMTYINQSGFTGLLYENGTATGILKQTIEGEQDMLMGFYYLTFLRTTYLSFTQSHYSIPLIIMIPSGDLLTPFEKLLKPFEPVVWFCLFISIGTGLIVIAIISHQSKKIRNFVFGEKTRNPYLVMVDVFFGGSRHNLPSRNFARYLLMVFMLFCLVQRSVYQGSLYIFLQSDGRKPDVATIDEMIEKGFVFYIRETLEHNIRHMNFYDR